MRFRPKVDRLYFILMIPTLLILLGVMVPTGIAEPSTLYLTTPILIFVLYFFVSPLFGYVETRDDGLFIKYGFFIRRSIPYGKIRSLCKKRAFYSDSIISLKNSYEHVDIKYNAFDFTAVSVKDNDALISVIQERMGNQ